MTDQADADVPLVVEQPFLRTFNQLFVNTAHNDAHKRHVKGFTPRAQRLGSGFE